MMGHTHFTVGIACGLAIALLNQATLNDTLLIATVAGAAALLPDIDHPKSSLRRRAGLIGHVGLFWLKHRGITHTLAALMAVSVLAAHFITPVLALAVTVGYASHLITDMMTMSGLPLLWPWYGGSIHLLPRFARIRTNAISETFFVFVVMAVVFFFMTLIF
jgi:inner membrane protein